jgi:hypothetical protein
MRASKWRRQGSGRWLTERRKSARGGLVAAVELEVAGELGGRGGRGRRGFGAAELPGLRRWSETKWRSAAKRLSRSRRREGHGGRRIDGVRRRPIGTERGESEPGEGGGEMVRRATRGDGWGGPYPLAPPTPSRWRGENGAAAAGCGGDDARAGAGKGERCWAGPTRPGYQVSLAQLFFFFLFSVSVFTTVLQMLGLKCTFIK